MLSNFESPPADILITKGDVHLWRVELDRKVDVPQFSRLLSDDERIRLQQYRYERDQRRFGVCRGALRTLLGRYLRCPPQDVVLGYGEHRKPYIARSSYHPLVRFNVSHSGERALLGFCMHSEIGVDIEQLDPHVDVQSLATAVLSDSERAVLMARDGEQRTDTFFQYWTNKEAYIKARGQGMHLAPDSFSVAVNRSTAELLLAPPCESDPSRWIFARVDVASAYSAAVVCEKWNAPLRYSCFDYTESLGTIFW